MAPRLAVPITPTLPEAMPPTPMSPSARTSMYVPGRIISPIVSLIGCSSGEQRALDRDRPDHAAGRLRGVAFVLEVEVEAGAAPAAGAEAGGGRARQRQDL